jgi:Family of unknown function (DUF5681)
MAKRFDPEIGLTTRFRPGESGNPLGRPRQKPIAHAIERALLRNPNLLEQIALTAVRKAAAGDVRFFCEIRDMLDGLSVVPVQQSEPDDFKNRFKNMSREELVQEAVASKKRLAEIGIKVDRILSKGEETHGRDPVSPNASPETT